MSGYMEIAGSGSLRVTTADDVQQTMLQRETAGEDIWQSQVNDFLSGLTGIGSTATPRMAERIWVANRCMQLNSQQISRMPLRFYGSGNDPAWVANPDPSWYPNGIGDAVFAAVHSMYAWGDAFLYVTSRYANGYPAGWTVLDPEPMTVQVVDGQRTYRSGNVQLNPTDMVQVSRDPGGVRGTGALKAYGSNANSLLAASDLGQVLSGTGMPNAILKMNRKIGDQQALKVQQQWAERTALRRGLPAVLPPEIDFQTLAYSPSDLLLVDVQQWDAQVIASAYGVPALFLNMSVQGGLVYQTPTLAMEHWWRTELLPTSSNLAQAMSAQMLPAGNIVEFDARKAIAPTFGDLVDAFKLLVDTGVVTRDEARAAVLGLPPQEEPEAIQDLLTPPSAGASPAQQPGSVVELRPTQAGNP